MNFAIHQASRIGGRQYNQDRVAHAYTDQALLLVMADGMGGHLHGETAAQIAVEAFMHSFSQFAQPRLAQPEEFLRITMRRAHEAIMQYAHDQMLGGYPGTTCVAALVQDGRVCWTHAGDSRLYLLRDNKVAAVTHDHSVVQQWADRGFISAADMKTHPSRNKITNCLGGMADLFYAEAAPAVLLQTGDVLLLCSDGLCGPLPDAEIASAFGSAQSLPETLEYLLDRALSCAGERADNTTAVAARWGDAEEVQPAPVPICRILDC